MQRRERFSRVVNAVQALPDKQREVIVRHALDGDSHEAIASDMGMTAGAIRQLAHRARATVRAAAASLFPAPLARFLPWGAESVPAAKVAAAVVVAGAAGGGAIEVARHDPLPRRAEAVAKAPDKPRAVPKRRAAEPVPTAVATRPPCRRRRAARRPPRCVSAIASAAPRPGPAAATTLRTGQRRRRSSGSGSGSSGPSDSSGPGSGGSDSQVEDSSGHGSGGDDSSGSGSSGSGVVGIRVLRVVGIRVVRILRIGLVRVRLVTHPHRRCRP